MIPVGETYRLQARLDARSIVVALTLGIVTALLAAGLIWAWEASRVPTLLIVTPLIQGTMVGGALMLLVGRLRLHHPRLLWTLGLLCGLTSVGMVHYVHYLRFLDAMDRAAREQIEADDEIPADAKQRLLGQVADGTFQAGQRVLGNVTGRTGLVGFLILRTRQGFDLGKEEVKGAGVWFLWLVEAGITAGVAAAMTRSRTVEPFCGDCGEWLARRQAPVALLSESAPALADAILADDADAVADLLAQPVDPAENERDATRVGLIACPRCGQTFVNVGGYLIDHDGDQTQIATVEFLQGVRVSDAVADLLRDPPPPGSRPDLAELAHDDGSDSSSEAGPDEPDPSPTTPA